MKVILTFLTVNLLPAVILLAVGILVIQLIMKILTAAFAKSKLEQPLYRLLLKIIKPVLYALLLLMIADKVGIDVTGIVALASVLTLAISLALQGALANIFGGFTLLNTKPFVAGDFVEIAGQSGTVKEVGLAYTKLTTPDNKVVLLPNSAVVADQIVNYTTSGTRRLDITVTAAYESKREAVVAALLEAAQIPEVLADPAPFAALSDYGESSVSYVLRVWVAADDYWKANYDILGNLSDTFARHGVTMSYPHVNVHMLEK